MTVRLDDPAFGNTAKGSERLKENLTSGVGGLQARALGEVDILCPDGKDEFRAGMLRNGVATGRPAALAGGSAHEIFAEEDRRRVVTLERLSRSDRLRVTPAMVDPVATTKQAEPVSQQQQGLWGMASSYLRKAYDEPVSTLLSIGKGLGVVTGIALRFLSNATGLTGMYEGIREGDWKKFAIGACQFAGTALAFVSGAGFGMIIAGAVLQNMGTITSALASGDPMAIGGALLAVALTVVVSKYGNQLIQKAMGKIAPVGKEVVKDGLLKVGDGVGHKVGADIIAEKGADKVTKLGVDAMTRASRFVSEHLESFVGPEVEAAKKMFGATSEKVGQVASDKLSELSVKALTPEINGVMTSLGVTDKVAAVVRKEILDKAAKAGVLGQFGFGGGRVLSYFGFGNSALQKSIAQLAPELGDQGSKELAKHLCRAVQQGGYEALMKESLTAGITNGLRASLKSVLEDPMKQTFMKGISGSVSDFVQRHGIQQFEAKMLQSAELAFESTYVSVLGAHVRAGVEKAFKKRPGFNLAFGAGAAEAMRHEAAPEVVVEVREEQALPVEPKMEDAALVGNDLATKQEVVIVDGVSILRTYCQVVGRFGPEWQLVSEVEHVRAAKELQRQALAEAA